MTFAIKAKAQGINFVAKFEEDIKPLLAVLGKSDLDKLQPGQTLTTYPMSGKLSADTVAEGALIPDSKIGVGTPASVVLKYEKYRNLVPVESVQKYGYDVAVGGSNAELSRQVKAGVRTAIYNGIKTGTGTASGATLQAATAAAWGELAVAHEGESVEPVFFVNPLDLADYLGTATITTQSAFGVQYLENFLGLGTLIVDTNVGEGKVIACAKENLQIACAAIDEIADDMVTDETGIVAVHHGTRYENAAIESVCYFGLACAPFFADRVIVSTIAAA